MMPSGTSAMTLKTVLVPLTSIAIVRGRCVNAPAQAEELLSLHCAWAPDTKLRMLSRSEDSEVSG